MIDCDVENGCYCNVIANCECVCKRCKSQQDCPSSHYCNNGSCVKAECQDSADCPNGWCCSSNHECVSTELKIHCKSSNDCKMHFKKTNCQEKDDTCMGSGICGPNICREDNDCYLGYYCLFR